MVIAGSPHKIYKRIFELLLLPDCYLLLTALNTLYNLTILGDQATDKIIAVDWSMSILLDLLTLRVETFGEKALARVKLIDTAPPTTKSSVGGATSSTKPISTPGRGVQLRVVGRGGTAHPPASNTSKKIGGGGKVNSVAHGATSVGKTQMLKIGNTVIPTLNLGKKESGGIMLSPLVQSTSNPTPMNPVVKAILSSNVGPLTLDQLQSLLVKNIPALPQSSASNKSQPSLSMAQSSTVNQTKLVAVAGPKQPASSAGMSSDGISPLRVPAQTVATPTKAEPTTAVSLCVIVWNIFASLEMRFVYLCLCFFSLQERMSGESYATSW